MATTTPSSRLAHLKICRDCSGAGTRPGSPETPADAPAQRLLRESGDALPLEEEGAPTLGEVVVDMLLQYWRTIPTLN